MNDPRTGRIHFSERLSQRGQVFTASPVSDGSHLYFASGLGNVFAVAVETKLNNIQGIHPRPETCMATPAISDDTPFFRTRPQLIASGEDGDSFGVKLSAQTAAAAALLDFRFDWMGCLIL